MSNKRRYSIFHPWVMSFYSKSLYRDVGQRWRGCGFFYVFLLLLVCWLPLTYQFSQTMYDLEEKLVPVIANEVPQNITFKDGELSINEKMPYVIKDPDSGDPIIVVDTSGQINNLSQTDAQMLITKDKVMVHKNDNEIRTYEFDKNMNFTITHDDILNWVNHGQYVLLLSFLPFMLIMSFLYRVIQAIVYAAIGCLIFARLAKVDISYQAMVRLSIIAVTPAIIISTVLQYCSISFNYEWTLYFLLTMLYLIYGIRANREPADSPVLEVPEQASNDD